jgi:hypothetical protein
MDRRAVGLVKGAFKDHLDLKPLAYLGQGSGHPFPQLEAFQDAWSGNEKQPGLKALEDARCVSLHTAPDYPRPSYFSV